MREKEHIIMQISKNSIYVIVWMQFMGWKKRDKKIIRYVWLVRWIGGRKICKYFFLRFPKNLFSLEKIRGEKANE